jgi:hypothetical protein
MVIAEMGKAKPKLEIDTVFEWVGYDIPNYMRKMRLKCCAAAEKMSDSWGPHYFYDEHYPEFTTAGSIKQRTTRGEAEN